jgi:hypothetical protein
MSSKEKKRERLNEGRLLRAREYSGIDTTNPATKAPPGSVPADQNALSHNNTYSALPCFYVDTIVVCRRCGKEEVWPAHRQKWWYEIAKGNINTTAVFCRSCRGKGQQIS